MDVRGIRFLLNDVRVPKLREYCWELKMRLPKYLTRYLFTNVPRVEIDDPPAIWKKDFVVEPQVVQAKFLGVGLSI